MQELPLSPGVVRFEGFEADPRAGELRKQGRKIKLQEKPFQLLCTLLQHPGEVVTREELRERVAHSLGKPLKPRDVKFVRDLPRTRNAKLMRRLVRAAYLGEPTGDVSSLENPRAVEEIRRAL